MRCHPRALSCKIIAESGLYGAAGRASARSDCEAARYRLLRNGRRVRNDGIEAPTVFAGGGTDAGKNSRRRTRSDVDSIRNKLPSPNLRIIRLLSEAYRGNSG